MKRTETFVFHFEGEEGQMEFERLMEIFKKGAPGVWISSVAKGDKVKRLDEAEELLYELNEKRDYGDLTGKIYEFLGEAT